MKERRLFDLPIMGGRTGCMFVIVAILLGLSILAGGCLDDLDRGRSGGGGTIVTCPNCGFTKIID